MNQTAANRTADICARLNRKSKSNPVSEAIAQFPATFQLRASAVPFGDASSLFRISPSASYVNDSGDVQLILERDVDGKWLEGAKVYIAELADFIIWPAGHAIETEGNGLLIVHPSEHGQRETVKPELLTALYQAVNELESTLDYLTDASKFSNVTLAALTLHTRQYLARVNDAIAEVR